MALQTALGRALYRAPGALRHVVPHALREGLRRRIGPFAPWEAGFDQIPPAPRAGEVARAPDFVGIGVQKAGTTWWFELISAHPDVFHRPGVHKERHYFAQYATEAFGPQAVRYYHDWFARPEGLKAGEWTPDYFHQPWVPALLAQVAPEARLLLMVRDPIDRFLSGLAHGGLPAQSQPGLVLSDAVARGFYASALRLWMTHFHRGRILVLQYERCVADPTGQLDATYRFLELEDGFRPANLRAPQSPTFGDKAALAPDARRRLVELYGDDVRRLAELVPDLDLSLWSNFGAR